MVTSILRRDYSVDLVPLQMSRLSVVSLDDREVRMLVNLVYWCNTVDPANSTWSKVSLPCRFSWGAETMKGRAVRNPSSRINRYSYGDTRETSWYSERPFM